MKLRRLISYCALFLASLTLAVGCSTSSPAPDDVTQTPSPAPDSPIVLGYSNWVGWLPWAVADAEDLFEANGANVELKWFDSALASVEAMVAGQLDANSQTLNETVTFAPNAVNGQTIVLINDNSAGNDKIIAAEGINSVSDLKGKQVAVEEGIVGDFLLSLALEKNGLTRDDVEIVNMETGAASAAFSAGQLDAVVAWIPFTETALKRNGSQEILSSQDFPGAIPDLLVVSQTLAAERPDQVQAIVNTWFDTLEFIKQNPDRANQIMAERAGVTVEEIQQFQSGVKFFSPKDNLTAFSSGEGIQHLPYASEEIAEFVVNAGFLTAKPSLNNVLDSRFVEAYLDEQSS